VGVAAQRLRLSVPLCWNVPSFWDLMDKIVRNMAGKLLAISAIINLTYLRQL
jgi:hypothetical protein